MMNCFCGMVDRRKAFRPYFQPGPLSEILTISNLRHAASRTWTWAEPEFRFCWMKFCSGDTTERHWTPQITCLVSLWNLLNFKEHLFWRTSANDCRILLMSMSKELRFVWWSYELIIFVLQYFAAAGATTLRNFPHNKYVLAYRSRLPKVVLYGNYKNCVKSTEAVVWSFSVKKMFLEILQNSLGTTCARASFLIKLQVSACNFITKEALVQVFYYEFCEISKNTYFYRIPPVAASESTRKYILQKSFLLKGWSSKLLLHLKRM